MVINLPAPPYPHVYHDFEFNDADGVLAVTLDPDDGEFETIDLRTADGVSHLAACVAQYETHIWASYSLMAEIESFLRLGINIDKLPMIDLFSEARQVCCSHQRYWTKKGSLLAVLEALGLPQPEGSVARKLAMRQRILAGGPFSDAEMAEILAYNADDVRVLRPLWTKLRAIHRETGTTFRLRQPVYRGQFLKSLAKLERRSPGFPVDAPLLRSIYEHLPAIRTLLAQECNAKYTRLIGQPADLFRWNKTLDAYSLHYKGIERMLTLLPYDVGWQRTPTGRLKTETDYLSELAARHEAIVPLQETLMILSQLKATNLCNLLRPSPTHAETGYLPAAQAPLWTSTGRSQPFLKRGFIFSGPNWLRHLVRPEPGQVLIYADWSAQEVHLAAMLSGDHRLGRMLQSDIYLAIGQLPRVGLVPADINLADAAIRQRAKAEYSTWRDVLKTIVLGLGYGSGAASIGQRLYLEMRGRSNRSLRDWQDVAQQIISVHKQQFPFFWRWVQETIKWGKFYGAISLADGWTTFADRHSKPTRLQNFPAQGAGAMAMRETIVMLEQQPVPIQFVATLHDGVLILASEAEAEQHTAILVQCMRDATRRVTQTCPFQLDIPIEVNTYRYPDGYRSKRGTPTFNRILKLLNDEVCRSSIVHITEQ